ncbi:hypothetical protein K504DRAFT_503034 [Pleomassaria siparia CBS 279.74]|uniref:Uncharacterized protein n=1 Tax=Pleomassaria siparia CBS 279.74 TaxID=1314801 RepID=A0A6G1K889_9PLEO|nr:hypothetical protein K504DRAFT_503034 [Pleomassaria siparia CBS 279.74]
MSSNNTGDSAPSQQPALASPPLTSVPTPVLAIISPTVPATALVTPANSAPASLTPARPASPMLRLLISNPSPTPTIQNSRNRTPFIIRRLFSVPAVARRILREIVRQSLIDLVVETARPYINESVSQIAQLFIDANFGYPYTLVIEAVNLILSARQDQVPDLL